ncbi:MAG: hypothetical protein RL115_1252 [Bacteroidota bacterium]|jgi:hypothetical protein
MIDTILQIVSDSTKVLNKPALKTISDYNYWIWFASIELLIIFYLLGLLLKRKKNTIDITVGATINKAKTSMVDMGNVIDSIHQSRQLYKQLCTKCHPDRFTSDYLKQKIAEDLFQEITRNQRNFNKLLELKELAQKKLNITV